MAKDTMGIDVSKDRLDAFWHSQEEACSVANTAEGFEQLCAWIGQNDNVLIVFEATGAYHRGLERHLSLAGHPYIKVNPKQARRFAQAIGRLAKTDSVDAKMLARMGVVLDLNPQQIESKDVHDLRELLTARRALVKDQITAKTRLSTALNPLIREQLSRRIDDISADVKTLDEAIAQILWGLLQVFNLFEALRRKLPALLLISLLFQDSPIDVGVISFVGPIFIWGIRIGLQIPLRALTREPSC